MKLNTCWPIILITIFTSGCMFYPGGDDVISSYNAEPLTEEVMGEDIPDIPGYEPGIRTEYMKDIFGRSSDYEYFIRTTYYTTDDMETVTRFYFDEMPKYNWKLTNQDAHVNEGKDYRIRYRSMDYAKSDCNEEFCTPTAYITIEYYEPNGYTLIHIGYNNRGSEL